MIWLKKYNVILIMAMLIIIILLTACIDRTNVDNFIPNESIPAMNEVEKSSEISADEVIEEPQARMYEGDLELPVVGATGFTSISLELKEFPKSDSETIDIFEAGTAFEILREEGDWWFIKRGDLAGWLQHNYTFINLPDVIPSIIYDNTNTYSSKFVSSGKDIPNISNRALYPGKTYNERLESEEYIMPVLYSMSKKVHLAQQLALSEGNSLKIYEGFRPYSVQKAVVEGLSKLADDDPEVMTGINTLPWGINWFITDGVSNHQMGYGIDLSLVKINSKKEVPIGEYTRVLIKDYMEYAMPTQIHELSGASAVFTTPVSSQNAIDWKTATYADSMNEAAIKLQTYATTAGLTPLASEWWHFNDLDARDETAHNSSEGDYLLTEIYSSSPLIGDN